MKTLKVLAGVGLVNLALVIGLVLFFDAASVPAAPIVPPVGQALAPTSSAPVVLPPPTGAPTPNRTVPAVPPPQTSGPTPMPPPVVQEPIPQPVNRCIVTIEGNRYDVTPLKSTHSGGDIFVCGTDMTATFFTQHDRKMLEGTLQQFRVQ
jgi:hypothetical protein